MTTKLLLLIATLVVAGCATTPAPTAPGNSDPAIYRPTKPAYYPTPYE